jgi:hypothetical protein
MKPWKTLATIVLIVLSFVGLIWFFQIGGLIAGIFETLLVVALINPERSLQFVALLLTIGRKFSFWAEKNKVQKYLEGTIGLTSKKMNEDGIDVLPHGVQIKWVEPTERDVFLKDGKVVVCLSSSYNQARNLSRATMLYVEEDLVRESQRFIEPVVMKSSKLMTARKLLMIDKKIDALKYLNEEFVQPEMKRIPEIAEHMLGMEKMDERGHFTRILLREFSQLGPKLSYKITDQQAIKETKTFADFLQVFEEREREEDVPLSHDGKLVRVNLLPVRRAGTTFDTTPYVKRAQRCFQDKIDTLYVLAMGITNVTLAELVVEQIEKEGIFKKQKSWTVDIPRERSFVEDDAKKKTVPNYICVLARIG